MLLALEALPTRFDDPDRPLVLSAEGALARATLTLMEIKTQLDHEHSIAKAFETQTMSNPEIPSEIIERFHDAHRGGVEQGEIRRVSEDCLVECGVLRKTSPGAEPHARG